MKTICEIFSGYNRVTDKNTDHTYGPVYEQLLAPLRTSATVVMELGIGANGGALRVWREYFQNARIIGVDIDPERMVNEDRITSVEADLFNTTGLIPKIWPHVQYGSIDLIVDDGPHHLNQQLACMACLWRFLKPGGLYCIEDASELINDTYTNMCAIGWLPTAKYVYDARVSSNRHDDVLFCFEK